MSMPSQGKEAVPISVRPMLEAREPQAARDTLPLAGVPTMHPRHPAPRRTHHERPRSSNRRSPRRRGAARRLAQPDAGGRLRRQPPVARRRDR